MALISDEYKVILWDSMQNCLKLFTAERCIHNNAGEEGGFWVYLDAGDRLVKLV
jgi:hypothetical protein